ncbi:type II secretion system F family protein [Streptomyces lunaelactis]|uniref:type II secretion system F family protein n=1 Tax=Streptomyces lunaelactis TaxID=1535768 RepID=UPI001585932B|nr:type II secretion system F family protein [Streptomyces lunaelactis]NUK00801.1 type II secretion system F family protein [Streptomyces lunaelactis]NUK20983.1 type II secretion system F family protein [Streptomyces lunaelactis]
MTGDAVHRLGAVVSVLAAAACLGFAVGGRRRERRVRRRIEALLAVECERRRWRPECGTRVRRWAAPLGAVITGCVLVGGVTGGVVGLAGAYGVWRWQRSRKPGPDIRDREASRQLPLAADLLAACISAGAGPREAAEAVGESLGGPVGERLARAAAELRLGSEPAQAWGWFGRIPGAAALARCLERADSTGAPAAEPVARLAERFRADRARTAVARGHKAQVLITAPVGLCFLPAFLAVGVAPVVIGLAGGLLNGN